MYHFPKPMKCMDSLFYAAHSYVNTRDIIKHWVKEPSKFKQTPTHACKTKSLGKAYQFLIIFSCRIYRQKSTKTFREGWEILLDQLVRDGRPFNWSDLLVQQLKSHVAKAWNLPKNEQTRFFMSKYLLDAICAQQQFPSMNWTWTPQETTMNIYFKSIFYCSYQGVMARLTYHFIIPLYKLLDFCIL